MGIEEIVRAWKSGEDFPEMVIPASPAGTELSEEELLQIVGGMSCCPALSNDCTQNDTCWISLGN